MNRANNFLLLAVALVAGFAGGMCASWLSPKSPARSVRTNRLEIVDSSGNVRAILESGAKGSSLRLFDTSGNSGVTLKAEGVGDHQLSELLIDGSVDGHYIDMKVGKTDSLIEVRGSRDNNNLSLGALGEDIPNGSQFGIRLGQGAPFPPAASLTLLNGQNSGRIWIRKVDGTSWVAP